MLKRFILWEYKRGSWQYDIIVGLILAFIFLTPREWFRDQPRIPKASGITMLPSEHGQPASYFYVEAALLAKTPENERFTRLSDLLLQTRVSNRRLAITRLDPILDSEGELQGYVAFTKP